MIGQTVTSVTSDGVVTTLIMRLKEKEVKCYNLKSLESDNRTTLVLSNTRELDRDLFTK